MVRMVPPVLPHSFAAFQKIKFFKCRSKLLILDEVAKCRTEKRQKENKTRCKKEKNTRSQIADPSVTLNFHCESVFNHFIEIQERPQNVQTVPEIQVNGSAGEANL